MVRDSSADCKKTAPLKFLLDILKINPLRTWLDIVPPRMKRQSAAKVIKFAWGSLPADALDRQTMTELRVIANRKGRTIEQVMSAALDWVLSNPGAEFKANAK
jgi:hypothetical protein